MNNAIQHEETYGIWQAIRIIFTSGTNMIVAVFRSGEKFAKLGENEIDNLTELQKRRFEEEATRRENLLQGLTDQSTPKENARTKRTRKTTASS